ncbi:prenyltransferase/squalene oxidase repeat-containing protein [Glycomyces sp. NPDC046736]|uniref:prenyltransferase/squalene oxidase repeat-containing protein n=1 Tax=Glycomyces sp. NPDC046736 TaxID=3155615 RepID=UPI0033F47A7E
MRRRRWPTEVEVNESLALAAAWLKRHQLPGPPTWPVSAGGDEPSLWGGTVDAVCAIAALRRCDRDLAEPFDELDLGAVRRWAAGQQLKDGSFNAGEFGYAGAEPTAWALIALHAISPNSIERDVKNGLAYLESCIDTRDGSVASTPGGELPRTMPSALTLWAFALWRHRDDLRSQIVSYLQRCQDNASAGWGVTSSARPNPATTAQVLVAFQAARVPVEEFALAVAYLVEQQRENGRWPNSLDEWHTQRSRNTLQLTNKVVNNGTAWSLLALAQLRDHRSRTACLRAVNYLIGDQWTTGPDLVRGSWALSYDGAHRHVWLTGQIVVAIAAWRSALPRQGVQREGMRLRNALLTVVDVIVARASLISMLGVLGAVVALTIDSTDSGLRDRLVGDGVTFRQSLLTSGLATAMIGAISWVYRGVRNWQSRRRRE